MIIMENAVSGVRRPILGRFHRLWCFLFGFIYYASKGAWGWAVISLFTANGLWIGLPLFNRTIIVGHYENKNWRRVTSLTPSAPGRPDPTQRGISPPGQHFDPAAR